MTDTSRPAVLSMMAAVLSMMAASHGHRQIGTQEGTYE